ncbi:MAG: hypothetical protein NVSMB49_24740 [Ktedonobacteraceae bacterium]
MDQAREQGQLRAQADQSTGLVTSAVTTYKGNTLRTGQYSHETFLTPSNVTVAQFGKRGVYPSMAMSMRSHSSSRM